MICEISGLFFSRWLARTRNRCCRSGWVPRSEASCCNCSSLLPRWKRRFCSSHSTSLIRLATFLFQFVLVQQPEQRDDGGQQQHDAQLGQGEKPAQAAGADGRRKGMHGRMLTQPPPAHPPIVEIHNADVHNGADGRGCRYSADSRNFPRVAIRGARFHGQESVIQESVLPGHRRHRHRRRCSAISTRTPARR